jgi:hypothetical protein
MHIEVTFNQLLQTLMPSINNHLNPKRIQLKWTCILYMLKKLKCLSLFTFNSTRNHNILLISTQKSQKFTNFAPDF